MPKAGKCLSCAGARDRERQNARTNRSRGWGRDPILGSVNGEHAVYFKTSDDGETLISDRKHGPKSFDSTPEKRGTHDHFGRGNGRNNNGTNRGYYTGPGN